MDLSSNIFRFVIGEPRAQIYGYDDTIRISIQEFTSQNGFIGQSNNMSTMSTFTTTVGNSSNMSTFTTTTMEHSSNISTSFMTGYMLHPATSSNSLLYTTITEQFVVPGFARTHDESWSSNSLLNSSNASLPVQWNTLGTWSPNSPRIGLRIVVPLITGSSEPLTNTHTHTHTNNQDMQDENLNEDTDENQNEDEENITAPCPVCNTMMSVTDLFIHMLYEHPDFLAVWSSVNNWESDADADDGDTYAFLSRYCEQMGDHLVGVTDIDAVAPFYTINADQQANDRCVICLDTFDDIANDYSISYFRKLKNCGHVYCVDCIEKWLSCHKNCPICKNDLQSDVEPHNEHGHDYDDDEDYEDDDDDDDDD